ncbi:MAG: hypothetical protein MHMPM18_001673 [Marteilia pararefringens]
MAASSKSGSSSLLSDSVSLLLFGCSSMILAFVNARTTVETDTLAQEAFNDPLTDRV